MTNYKFTHSFIIHNLSFKIRSGQALVTLLVFMIIAITVTSAGIVMILVNSTNANTLTQGTVTPMNAETGIENALVRLERDPNYAGEAFNLGTTVITVTVTGGTTKTITSTAVNGSFSRTIVVTADDTNNVLTVTNWKETY